MIFHDSFWHINRKRSIRIRASNPNTKTLSHVKMKVLDDHGREAIIMAEIKSIFMDSSDLEFKCECYFLYSEPQFSAHLPWLNANLDPVMHKKGLKRRTELVICKHACIMPLSCIVEKARVTDNMDTSAHTVSAGTTHFYRYAVDTVKGEVLALRTGCV